MRWASRLHGRAHRWLAPIIAIAALMAPAAVPVPAAAATALSEVARLPAVMSNDTRFLVADAPARRIFEIGQPADRSGMWIVAYDLDSLNRIAMVPVTGSDSGYGGRLAAVDELRHRLFVVVPLHVLPGDDSAVRGALGKSNRSVFDTSERLFFGIAVIDTLSLRVLGIRSISDVVPALPQDTSFSNNAGLKALLYDPPADKLYLETEDTTTRAQNLGGPADHVVFVHQLDASKLLASASSALDWSYAVTACPMALTGVGAVTSVMLRTRGVPNSGAQSAAALLVPCRHSVGEPGGIARINLRPGSTASDTANFSTEFFAMPGTLPGLVVADPTTDRLFVRVDAATGETGVWGFDGRAGAWLGVMVTPGPRWGLGVDTGYQRLYALSAPNHTGTNHVDVVVSATDATPTDQGLLAQFQPHADPVIGRAVVDPIRHRFFWSTFLDYMVVGDNLPKGRAAVAVRPDLNTLDVAEGVGTAANYFAGARAYGSRVRWVGGTRGPQQNANSVVENVYVPPLPREISDLLPAGPADGTRDIHFARVANASLSNGEASAVAQGAQYDDQNTGADFSNLDGSARRFGRLGGGPAGEQTAGTTVEGAQGALWPYRAAHCADFGGGKAAASGAGADASCSLLDSAVQASSLFEQTGPGDVVVAKSTSSITQRRDPARGIVAEAHAEAQGIRIGDQVLIGKVTSTARTAARGRPGSANATYERTIEDVKIKQPDGSFRSLCTSPCSPDAVADAVNRSVGSRIQIAFPRPDSARLKGTPGGYEGLVVRDFYEQINNSAQNNEADIRLEVPAVEITVIADSRVRSRTVTSLAATSAESHYGIYLLSAAVGSDALVIPRAPAPPPVVVGSNGSVVLTTTSAPAAAPDGLRTVLHRFHDGIRFILSKPAGATRAFGLWSLFAAPLVLASRRRRLQR